MAHLTEICCIASGPSLTPVDVEIVKAWRDCGTGRAVIAVNNNFLLAPWADIIYGCDGQWWTHYYKAVREDCRGELVAYSQEACELFRDIKHEAKLLGSNSGYQAITLAARRGARIVYLIGYDYQHTDGKKHWHPDHADTRVAIGKLTDIVKFNMKEIEDLSIHLSLRGVSIFNCTRQTALKCFQRLPIEALGL